MSPEVEIKFIVSLPLRLLFSAALVAFVILFFLLSIETADFWLDIIPKNLRSQQSFLSQLDYPRNAPELAHVVRLNLLVMCILFVASVMIFRGFIVRQGLYFKSNFQAITLVEYGWFKKKTNNWSSSSVSQIRVVKGTYLLIPVWKIAILIHDGTQFTLPGYYSRARAEGMAARVRASIAGVTHG